jgi:hypothetical protein
MLYAAKVKRAGGQESDIPWLLVNSRIYDNGSHGDPLVYVKSSKKHLSKAIAREKSYADTGYPYIVWMRGQGCRVVDPKEVLSIDPILLNVQ